jgi:hypothetical protein
LTKSSCPRAGSPHHPDDGGRTVDGMDVLAIALFIAAFAVLLALVDGLDRV